MIEEYFVLEVLIAAVSGGVLLKVVEAARQWRRDRAAERAAEQIHGWPRAVASVSTILETLSGLVASMPEADRALVLVAWPLPEGPKYSSVLYEGGNPTAHPIRPTWQRVRLDRAYVALVEEVVRVGWVRNETTKMPACDLRSVYQLHKVWGSDVAVIASDFPGCVVYLSVTWLDAPNGSARARMQSAARAIRAELEPQTDLHLAQLHDEDTGEVST